MLRFFKRHSAPPPSEPPADALEAAFERLALIVPLLARGATTAHSIAVSTELWSGTIDLSERGAVTLYATNTDLCSHRESGLSGSYSGLTERWIIINWCNPGARTIY